MEVTRRNFDEAFSLLEESIKEADFIAIDTEFTGLTAEGMPTCTKVDTLETFYLNQRKIIQSFLLIQYGIVLFSYNKNSNSYSHEAFNFYVYPSALKNYTTFSCQASSIKLLADHGFDFNKLITDGVPYLRDDEVEELLSAVEESYSKKRNVKPFPDEVTLPHWFDKSLTQAFEEMENVIKQNKTKEIVLPTRYSFSRLVEKLIENKFGKKVYSSKNSDGTMTAYVGLGDSDYHIKVQNEFEMKKKEILDNAAFNKVIKLIYQHRKLVVGHNVFKDIMYTINQFIQKLPESLTDFLSLTHFLFPCIIDTKYIAAVKSDYSDSNLFSIYEKEKQLKNNMPLVCVKNGRQGYFDNEEVHKAAYDAYLTGVCFLAIRNKLAKEKYQCDITLKPTISCPVIKDSLNCLSLPRINNTFVNVSEEYKREDRSNVFHITFPKEWQKKQISKVFIQCDEPEVYFISNTTAYVCFKSKDLVKVQNIMKVPNKNYEIRPFDDFHGLIKTNKEIKHVDEQRHETCTSKQKKRQKVGDT